MMFLAKRDELLRVACRGRVREFRFNLGGALQRLLQAIA